MAVTVVAVEAAVVAVTVAAAEKKLGSAAAPGLNEGMKTKLWKRRVAADV